MLLIPIELRDNFDNLEDLEVLEDNLSDSQSLDLENAHLESYQEISNTNKRIKMTPSLSAFINSLLLGLFVVIIPIGSALFLVSQADRVTRN